MLEEILRSGMPEMGIGCPEGAFAAFRSYYNELTETNKVINLTAISGEDDTARLHFLDSAAPLARFDMNGMRVIDVGTGAGFPGLPMKLVCPGMELTLLDSLGKRVSFLQRVCDGLGLSGVECIHARAEECGERREKYDYAVSRAVARLNVLCELCLPYVKPGGAFLALKGPSLCEELREAEGAIRLLGGRLEDVVAYTVPGIELSHSYAVIRKVSSTPKKYPRRFAQIKSAPL